MTSSTTRMSVRAWLLLTLLAVLTTAVWSFLDEALPEDSCVCSTQVASVHRRAGFEQSIRLYLSAGTCVYTAGGLQLKYGVTWYSLKLDSQALWCSGNYLANGTVTNDVCGLPSD